MERLTEDSVTGETYIKQCASSCPYDGDFCGTDECPVLNAVADKLGEYERVEEQGLLVRLPIKIGDMVWDNDFGYPESYEIKAFSYGYCDSYVESDIENQIIFYYVFCLLSIFNNKLLVVFLLITLKSLLHIQSITGIFNI